LYPPDVDAAERDWLKVKNPDSPAMIQGHLMTIDAGEAAIRTVIAGAVVESYDASGRAVDALLAIRQAEAIVRALAVAGYEIKRV
jgi:hypothetical protein